MIRLPRLCLVAARSLLARRYTTVGGLSLTSASGRGADDEDTIFALASAPGRGAVAVVRVSGSHAESALAAMLRDGLPPPPPRTAGLRTLRDPVSGETLDAALVLRFPAPSSFTGEDVVELHCHGGRAAPAAVLRALATAAPGMRPAAAGEFARRAFLAGKLDLVAAEALADLINADTEAQRRQALHQMSGRPAQLVARWRAALVKALALAEAHAEFGADEDDADERAMAAARADVSVVAAEVATHLAGAERGEELRSGFSVALIGAPNAGKSSLLNALAQRDVAIVSPTPGTTRDVLEVRLDVGGLPVTLSDTAGIRAAPADAVEAEGIRRARAAANGAALRLCLVDAADVLLHRKNGSPLATVGGFLSEPGALLVVNKTDLAAGLGGEPALQQALASLPEARPLLAAGRVHLISCLPRASSGDVDDGIGALLTAVAAHLQPLAQPDAVFVRARHAHHARACLEACRSFLAHPAEQLDLACEDLRLAAAEMGRLGGAVGVEEVLDELFAGLCIGK